MYRLLPLELARLKYILIDYFDSNSHWVVGKYVKILVPLNSMLNLDYVSTFFIIVSRSIGTIDSIIIVRSRCCTTTSKQLDKRHKNNTNHSETVDKHIPPLTEVV